MKIQVSLSQRQAQVISTIARASRMTAPEAIRTAAIATLTMGWDDRDQLRCHLIDVAEETRGGRIGELVR